MKMLDIQSKKVDNAVIINIKGDVDLYSSPQIRKVLLELIQKESPAIFVDLQEVNYMDSSGVATLVEALQRAKKYGGRLFIYHLQGAVQDVFELSRLDKVFQIYPDETEAMKAYHDEN
ncbi:anti-sigma factor antagonist [candidate division KSB1 bacterium]|nr:anti-sigma factor antagonist [candidate division KSB1 bacterium]